MRSRDRVCIGIPHAGTVAAELMFDLVGVARERGDRFDSIVAVQGLGLLTRTRNVIVQQFLDSSEAQWLLMLDSDQRLPLDTFDKLVASVHDSDRPVVAGLYFGAFFEQSGQLRPVPLIYSFDDVNGFQPIDNYPADSLIEIGAAGTGCILIHRSILEQMRENATESQGRDWAWFADGAIAGRWFSEDLLFCRKLAAMGVQMFAHTGALLPHRKEFWLTEDQHKGWLATC